MLKKLNKTLEKLNVKIVENNQNKELSDYLMTHNGNIIGNGWKAKNKACSIGFMGYASPNHSAENRDFVNMISSKISKGIDENQGFEKLLNQFQFALSEEYFWFMPPVGNIIIGLECPSLKDTTIFSFYVKRHVEKKNREETLSMFEKELLN